MLITHHSHLPKVVRAAANVGRSVSGSFIDEEWVLHYIVDGSWTFELTSRLFEVEKGDMILLPPRLLHVVKPLAGNRHAQWVLHFKWPEGPSLGSYSMAATPSRRARKQLVTLFSMLLNSAPRDGALFRSGLAAALVGIFVAHDSTEKPFQHKSFRHGPALEAAIRYLQDNISDRELRLADASKAAGISKPHFCRIFKNSLGVPAMRYLTQYRIQRAEQLLLNSTLNCTEIAELVGFDTVHSLSRVFKRETKKTPSNYRRTYGA